MPAKKINLLDVSIPKTIGSIQEKFEGRSEKTVFIIQDAHEIPDAQRSIQKLVDFVQKKYGVRLVALEGAASGLDPQIFKSFPDQKLLKKVFDQYFDDGELAGGTAASLFNDSPALYHGVEDWSLYEEGLKQFLDSMEIESGVEERLKGLFGQIKTEKQKHYSPKLLEIDLVLQAFRANASNLAEVLQRLAEIRPPEKGSELALVLEGIGRPKEDQQSIEIQVRKIARQMDSALKQKPAAKQDLFEFNRKFQEFQQGGAPEAFALYLKNLAVKHRIRVKVSKRLNYLVSNQKRVKDIEGTRFFDDFQKYAQSVKESLFENEEEKQIDAQARRLELMERLAKLELSREDWNEVKEIFNENQYWKKEKSGADREDISQLLETMRPQVSFYHNAGKRDAAFMERVESLFREQKNNSAVFIAGGFHAEGVTYNLKSKGISYVLVMPQMNQVPDQTHYREHMKGEVSWGDYFEDENGTVDLYSAFVRGTRDQLLKLSKEDRGKILKAWRDQILRDLAKTGKLASSAEYTRFIDEMVEGNALNKKWEENISRFIGGLRELKAEGNLTEENIAKLFRPALIPTGATAAPLAKNKLRRDLLPKVAAAQPVRQRKVSQQSEPALRLEIRARVSHLESMKVPGGRRGIWVNGKNLAKKAEMETVKRGVTSSQPVKTESGIEFTVDRSRFTEEEASQIEAVLTGIIHNLSSEDAALLIEQQNARGEGLKPIVITKFDDGRAVFADHTANGFVGIHTKLFDASIPKDTLRKILTIGLSHEMKHETLVRERAVLNRRLLRSENEPRLPAAQIKRQLKPDLKQAAEGELFEEDLDLAAELGLRREDLDPLIAAGVLSAEDGFAEGMKFHGDPKLRERHREFLEKYDAENHLIDRTDPEFHEVYESMREIFDELIKAAGLDPSFYRLYLSDVSDANAFYLRGSNAFVINIGLLRLLSQNGEVALSKDAIAFVLAHEIQHLRQYRDDVLKGKVNPSMDLQVNWGYMTDEKKQQYLDEYDADWNAVDLMSRAGYNVREAPQIFRGLLQLMQRNPNSKIYLPFGSHPQLQPRTLELENLVLRRYWPNASKPVSSFGNLKVPVSSFRDFQKRAYAMKSDAEFAQFIMEAKDIRELALVISIGKYRRAQQDYQHDPSQMTDESRQLKDLVTLLDAVEEKHTEFKKEAASEDAFKELERQLRELTASLSLPPFLIPSIQAGVNTDVLTFNSDGAGVGSTGRKFPWRGDDWVYFLSGPKAGKILLLKDGRIVMMTTGEKLAGDRAEIIDLQTRAVTIESTNIFFSAQYVNVKLDTAALTMPQAPMEAVGRRIEELKTKNPAKKLQTEFYGEMFKKYLDRSERFSPRRIEETSEYDPFMRRDKKRQAAVADPSEFDVFVRGVSTEDLLSALEGLVPVWIGTEEEVSEAKREYENLQQRLEGVSYGQPAYPRGDYIEFLDAVVREVENRINAGTAPLDVISKLIGLIEEMKQSFLSDFRGQKGQAKLRLFNLFMSRLQAEQAVLSRDSALALLELLDRLKFLSDSKSYFKERDEEATRMQDQIAQIVYGMYKNPETRAAVTALFQKHVKVGSPLKEKFYGLLSSDQGLDLNQKFEIADELGRDPRSLYGLGHQLMTMPAGEAEAYVSKIIAEITAKQPALAALENASEVLKRLAAITYLGANSLSAGLVFRFFDKESRRLLLSSEELRLFHDFISLGLADKGQDWNIRMSLVSVDKKKQTLLFLNLLEFLKTNNQDNAIFNLLVTFDSSKALGGYREERAFLYGDPDTNSYVLTPEGLQHNKNLRTFAMFLGELIDRKVDNEMGGAFGQFLGFGTSSFELEEEGYSITKMTERLKETRPQRFGRWDLTEDHPDKDALDFFSFLEEIYRDRGFQEAVEDLAGRFAESRLRDVMLHVLFVQKVLRGKLGIEVTPDKVFDFDWLSAQVREKGIPVHEEMQAMLPHLGWDRDIQKMNSKFLAELQNAQSAPRLDDDVYDQEKDSYLDLSYYDIGGKNAQLGLALAGLDETYLQDFLNGDRPLGQKINLLLQYYPKTSAYRDKHLEQILEQTLKSLEDGTAELDTGLEAEINKTLNVLQNISTREKFAVRFIEAALDRIQKLKGSLSLDEERSEVLKYLPDYSYTRDEVINQMVRRHIKEASRRYDEFSALLIQNPDNIRNIENESHLFWKEQVRDVMMNFEAFTKTEFLLWLMGKGEKPRRIMLEESRLQISFDGLKESLGLYKGKFYSGIGKRDQQEFFNSFFLGDKGIFSDDIEYGNFLDGVIAELIPAERNAVRELFKAILKTDDLSRRQRILMGLLQNFAQLQGIQDREVREAKSIRVFLEAYGFIGVKLGQFLAHSALVRPGSPLQKELSELNDSVEPMDVGILIDMLKKIYGQDVFEEQFEYLGELLGSASIKVVHKAKRKNGQEVVIKFKRPEIEKQIEQELAFFESILNQFAPMLAQEGIPVPAGLVKRLKEIFDEELNFGDDQGRGEAANQKRIKQNIENRKTQVRNGVTYELSVPNSTEVHENSVMIEEFAGGIALKKDSALRENGIDPEAIKEILMEELLQQFFFDGFYHADLHSGNVLIQKVEDKVRVHLIDLGAAAEISPANREALVGILMSLWDSANWEINKEVVFRFFPQIQGNASMEQELEEIVASNRNPVPKMLQLFGLLEKNNIEFQDEYRQFYSVIRFLKASEYLFSENMLERMKQRFMPSSLDDIKSKATAITTEVKRELEQLQIEAPQVTSVAGGMNITVTQTALRQTQEAIENIKTLPFWPMVATPFPQIDDIVNLLHGIVKNLADRGQNLEISILPEEMPVYEALKADVTFIMNLVREGRIGPFTIMRVLPVIRRIAGRRDEIAKFLLRQNLPFREIILTVANSFGIVAAGRLSNLLNQLETRQGQTGTSGAQNLVSDGFAAAAKIIIDAVRPDFTGRLERPEIRQIYELSVSDLDALTQAVGKTWAERKGTQAAPQSGLEVSQAAASESEKLIAHLRAAKPSGAGAEGSVTVGVRLSAEQNGSFLVQLFKALGAISEKAEVLMESDAVKSVPAGEHANVDVRSIKPMDWRRGFQALRSGQADVPVALDLNIMKEQMEGMFKGIRMDWGETRPDRIVEDFGELLMAVTLIEMARIFASKEHQQELLLRSADPKGKADYLKTQLLLRLADLGYPPEMFNFSENGYLTIQGTLASVYLEMRARAEIRKAA